jgi:glycosyltransferase involved in cell wall biosynthesis
MKIAFVVPSLGLAEGQGNANLELLRRVSRAGHDVDVFTSNLPKVATTLRAVRVRKIPRLPAWQLGNQVAMLGLTRALLRRGRYDVVHADAGTFGGDADLLVVHTVTARWLALPEARERGARGVNAAVATRMKARLEVRQARAAKIVLANSEMTAADLVERGVPRERVRVLPFGIDAERYRPPAPHERAAARSSFGLARDDFVVLFVGAHGPRKGLPAALEAMELGRARTGERLLVAGEHRGGAWARDAQARALPVVMPGKLDDVRLAYWSADVLVYPTMYDAFGMAVLEAMACGLPVVVAREAGSHEIVRDAGLVLSDRSAKTLRAAIDELRDDSAERSRMSARARELAVGRNWDEAGTILLAAYEELSR